MDLFTIMNYTIMPFSTVQYIGHIDLMQEFSKNLFF